MLLLSVLLFAAVLVVLAVAALRDLSTMEVVDPATHDDDTPVIRIAA